MEGNKDTKARATELSAAMRDIPDGEREVRRALRQSIQLYDTDPAGLLAMLAVLDGDALDAVGKAFRAAVGTDLESFLGMAEAMLEDRRQALERQEKLKGIPNALIKVADKTIGLLPVKIPGKVLSSNNPGAVLDAMRRASSPSGTAWTDIVQRPGLVPGVTYVPCTGEGLEHLPVINQDDWPVPRAKKYRKLAEAVLAECRRG